MNNNQVPDELQTYMTCTESRQTFQIRVSRSRRLATSKNEATRNHEQDAKKNNEKDTPKAPKEPAWSLKRTPAQCDEAQEPQRANKRPEYAIKNKKMRGPSTK